MGSQIEKINPFSFKNIWKSVFFPSSSGEEAAIEHIGNNRIEQNARNIAEKPNRNYHQKSGQKQKVK